MFVYFTFVGSRNHHWSSNPRSNSLFESLRKIWTNSAYKSKNTMQRASTYEVISFFRSQSDCQSILSPTYYHPILITISPPSLYPHQNPLHRLCNTPGSLSASLQHLTPLSDSPRVIQGMSLMHCRWACQWPIGLAQKTTVCGYPLPVPICVTAHV